ncbi:2' O-ribose methyltransferase [Fusarium falciforme]|nr:2' O-ribose methyltransferase [Fusarium falciforme]
MDAKYRLFKNNGQTVVDLGYAPGSWSQVAVDRTRPHGRVIGIDLIPAQPPQGVATFQGDFLSPNVQEMVKNFILDTHKRPPPLQHEAGPSASDEVEASEIDRPSYIDMERHASSESGSLEASESGTSSQRLVDVVLSDMLMNTSGNAFRDHAGSMDLCAAALQFASDTLKSGGHFVCKFYQGPEDKEFEKKLKTLFAKVFREKPESSRKESRESYFVGLRRKPGVVIEPPSHMDE